MLYQPLMPNVVVAYHVRNEHHLECVLVGTWPTSHCLRIFHPLRSNLHNHTHFTAPTTTIYPACI